MLKFIARWFHKREEDLPTRLSKKEALSIAREAAANKWMGKYLGMVSVEMQAGTPVWCISSTTRGQILLVFVDDTTGKVIEMRTVGIR